MLQLIHYFELENLINFYAVHPTLSARKPCKNCSQNYEKIHGNGDFQVITILLILEFIALSQK